MTLNIFRSVTGTLIGLLVFTSVSFAAIESQAVASTRSARNITFNSAEIEGQIDPKGEGPTAYWLEWGATDALGRVTNRNIEPRIDKFDATIKLTGLNQNSKYYYRLVIETPRGKKFGNIRSFTTKEFEEIYQPPKPECDDKIDNDQDSLIDLKDPDCTARADKTERYSFLPVAETGDASLDASNVFASLAARVTLGRAAVTQVWFEWGDASQTLNRRTPVREKSDFPFFEISEIITDLAPRQIYYYRVMAVNEFGLAEGEIKELKTKNAPAPAKQSIKSPAQNNTAAQNNSSVKTGDNQSPPAPLKLAPATPILITKSVKNISSPNGATVVTEANAGDIIRFNISVHNTGNQPIENIFVTDRVPDNLDFLDLSLNSIYSRRTKKIVWWLTKIEPQSSARIYFSAKTTQPVLNTLIENQASLISENKQLASNRAFLVLHAEPSQRLARLQNNQPKAKHPSAAQTALLIKTADQSKSSPSSLWFGLLALVAASTASVALIKNQKT